MSIKVLKELFTQMAPDYTCTSATLGYDRSTGREMQIIKFSGMTPGGNQFDLTSDPMKPDTPLQVAVAKMVEQLPKEQTP